MIKERCIEPDKCNPNNYVLDTNVFEHLAKNGDALKHMKSLFTKGHCYYITDVQNREIIGVPDRTGKYEDPSAWNASLNASKIIDIIESLQVKHISCVASLQKNFWLLDGSMRIKTGERTAMFNDIRNNNSKHLSDAQIAEAAIFNYCALITDDKKLLNKVNKHFPGKAILLNKYISDNPL